MAKTRNPPDATGRNVRASHKRDDKQNVTLRDLRDALNDLARLTDDRLTNLEMLVSKVQKKVRKLKKGH